MGGIFIRKVELTMDEQFKYETIKSLVNHPDGNKLAAAVRLGCTVRTVNRLILRYRQEGKAAFVHGNRGRQPVTTLPASLREKIVALYQNEYYGANFTHFTELLDRHENIHVSVSSVASILEAAFILSPKATRAKRKRIRRKLEAMKSNTKSKKKQMEIQVNLVAAEDAHSRRPRHAYFGEQLQGDATPYEWVPGKIWHLHLFIDDATGIVTGGYFDTQETLNGYYHVLWQTLKDYGIPVEIFTDKRTVFIYKQKGSPSIDEDTYTQFGYACRQLGIHLESSSVPQAKGRVERLNETLQSRLPIELRQAGITTIADANEFLKSYLKEFNAKFALPPNSTKSAFVTQPSDERINLILAVLTGRTVDRGHCIRFQRQYYRMLDSEGHQVHYASGTKVLVIRAFNGELYCSVNDTSIYALEAIPLRQKKSPELDADYTRPKPQKHWIPPMSHPWKQASFRHYVLTRPHHSRQDPEELALHNIF